MKIKNRLEQDSISGGKNIKKKIGALKRKTVPFLVVILVVTSALCYGQNSDCPSCIVGYWKMDETSGALAHDSINGNHGQLLTDGDGMDPVWVPGIVGNALDFAGDAPDAVVIGDDPAYHFGTGYFALEAWIKYEGPTDGSVMYPAIMSKRPGPPGSDPLEGFCLCLTYWGNIPGTLLLRIEDTNYYPCSTPVDDGNWHHVVVQRCRGLVEFYVDGLLDGAAASTKDATTDADLTLGFDSSSHYDTEWEGLIDEVALYNCCLSPVTIAIHHKQGLYGFGYSTCTCLYSSSETMQMLTTPDQWDVDNPPVSGWTEINVIPDHDADDSDWGIRFSDKPWHAMYYEGAHWVYGNVDWDDPIPYGHEYYKIPLTVQGGNCVTLHFKAYVDDTATFYITGPGYSTPTPFYTYPASKSMYEHDPAEFTIDIDGQPGPDCLQPGEYTIYIDHQDIEGVQYGLIFTAECVSCPCCECGEWGDVTVTWTSPSGTQKSRTGHCGESFGIGDIFPGTPIEINTSITCEPSPPCPEPNYEWEVTNVGGPPFSDSGVTLPVSFTPTATVGAFEVKVSASCGDSLCTPCTIIVNPVVKCMDITKKIVDPDTGELVDNIEVPVDTEVDFVITVCNCGTSDRENIKVVDYFFDCLEYLDSEASVTIDDISISGNQVVWEFGSLTLHPGDCFDIKVKAKVVSEGNCGNCVKVYAESQGESISDGDWVAVTVVRSGICLGSALLAGILALGVVVLNRKKE